ncbi:MAG: phosphate butyryltransferase [Muribaculaceae bacterium]|nr:phosphate butyryltransferase [Muribaculaceae bacterium]
MESITGFDQLIRQFSAPDNTCTVAVGCPDDEPTIETIGRCLKQTAVNFILITKGNPVDPALTGNHRLTVVDTPDADAAAAKAVELVRGGQADVLMKGNINTDNLLRAVLNKEHGLLPAGNVLTHIAVAEVPTYSKLLIFSDAAVIPRPTLDQFRAMITYDVEVSRKLGRTHTDVALIHFTEKVNPKFPHTLDYATLIEEANRGDFGADVTVGGPMDVKTACDAHSGDIKGITSPVAGKADVLIFPNLEAGNTFYKSVAFLAHGTIAGIIGGTSAPVVVPSRADSAESKFISLALATLMAKK